jgi:hypothetical protein
MTWNGGGTIILRLFFIFWFRMGGGGLETSYLPAILLEIIIFNPGVFIFPGHRCTHDTAENCRNDILVTGINRIGPSIREALLYPYRHMTGMQLSKSLLRSKIGGKFKLFLLCGFRKIVFRRDPISERYR